MPCAELVPPEQGRLACAKHAEESEGSGRQMPRPCGKLLTPPGSSISGRAARQRIGAWPGECAAAGRESAPGSTGRIHGEGCQGPPGRCWAVRSSDASEGERVRMPGPPSDSPALGDRRGTGGARGDEGPPTHSSATQPQRAWLSPKSPARVGTLPCSSWLATGHGLNCPGISGTS